MARVKIGDYVEIKATGKVGEVLERQGKKLLVRLKTTGEEQEDVLCSEQELQGFTIKPLTDEQMRAVVRGVIPVSVLTRDMDSLLQVERETPFPITPEDLHAGLKTVLAEGSTYEEAQAWWFYIARWSGKAAIQEAIIETDNREINTVSVLACTFEQLDEALFSVHLDSKDECLRQMRAALAVTEAWLSAGDDPERLDEYPDEMLNYLTEDLHEGNIDRQSKKTQDTFRRCIDILCERKDTTALEKRGYCQYCGTKVYPQSWEKAREDFREIYSLSGDAYAANVLGYLSYYGRCSDGVPDYEEAFRWFSIGSAGGNNESTYKLGDLFFDGYGVQKNPKIALRLYKDVYWRTLEQLLYGTDTSNFADAAWRLGDCYRYGRGL